MIQPELWMLTPFVLFIYLKIPLINAEGDKTGRKLNDKNENYIITHYGVEYYTPVTDIESPPHNSGYYTAEAIPVDVNTGEELKTVKNLFVPLHTGYSIGVESPQFDSVKVKKNDIDRKTATTMTADETQTKDDTKSKIPKKFKSKYTAIKRTNPNHNDMSTTMNSEIDVSSQTNVKINKKRNAEESSYDFLKLFYDNLRSLIQRPYLK